MPQKGAYLKIKMLSYASSGFVVCIGVDIVVVEKP
jgi:hypothetical protein